MKDANTTVAAAFGALCISVITGCFSLLGLVVSKEQKVSEFRQAWIDGLRVDFSDLLSRAQLIQAHIVASGELPFGDFLSRSREDYLGINQASFRVRLRLNRHEDPGLFKLLDAMEKALNKTRSDIVVEPGNLESIMKDLEPAVQLVLKREWERVKKGEKGYQRTKWITISVLVIVPIALVILFVLH